MRTDLKQQKDGEAEELLPPPVKEDKRRRTGLALRQFANATKVFRGRSTDVTVVDEAPSPEVIPDLGSRRSRPYLWSFLLLVLIPSIAAFVYFFAIASNQFQSEARFTVRAMEPELSEKGGESETAATPTSGSMIPVSTAQNAYIVANYIRSRAIIDDIAPQLNIREIFQRPEVDRIARLSENASIDELTDYWQRKVDAYVDPVSNIVTVNVTAFRAEDALRLNQAVLAESETLINRLSERARRDATQAAEIETRQVFKQLQDSLKALQDFRNKDALIDPSQSGTQITTLLMPLMTERLKLKNDEAVMAAELQPDAPSLRVLRNRIASLDEQIATLRGQLTGSDSQTLAASLAKYEELDVDRLLNERKYARAQAALDRAEIRARRQASYLSMFVPPSLPEFAKYPYRLLYPLMCFLSLLVIWAIGALTYASVEDHRL
ncbi:capsule biosynthesis protein [Labrys sp. KB_33_2]|uniref:capsule biosynthesis protein n=1 Tax=Labrys sp. KB_33_2 TaxID=3237479 RepID=UPI003F8F2A82